MADRPSSDAKDKSEVPAPEVLKPQSEAPTTPEKEEEVSHVSKDPKRARHLTYRPSHKATFIGIAVVLVILAVNVGVIFFVIKNNGDKSSDGVEGEVVISSNVLDKLGVSRNTVGDTGSELIVGLDSTFKGTLEVSEDVSIAGQLKLNSKFSAQDASLAKLEAGDTSLGQLNVNGDGTISSLTLRKDLTVAGATRLQGPMTISQLLTVNNNVNISGSLAVGGALSVNTLSVSNVVADGTLTVGGHIITRGSAPGVSNGPATGSNGTVSISGNDAAGTVAANVGTGSGGGIVATVTFRNRYGTTPHVVVTAIGAGAGSVYVNRSTSGFSIGVNGALAPGGYAFDYIVMQ